MMTNKKTYLQLCFIHVGASSSSHKDYIAHNKYSINIC